MLPDSARPVVSPHGASTAGPQDWTEGTPGSACGGRRSTESNGWSARGSFLRAWVDGRVSFESIDRRFRSVNRLKIELVWMNVCPAARSRRRTTNRCTSKTP